MLPRNLRSLLHRAHPAIGIDPLLVEASNGDEASALRRLESDPEGLSEAEAARRLARDGPNAVARAERFVRLRLLARACINPLVVLLALLMILEITTGDARAATVMGLMIVLGVSLRFIQEARATDAAAKLRAMIRVTATVLRDGKPREVPLGDLVAGDVVALAAGDIIPADVRLLSCRNLHVAQSALTGESLPVEKALERDPGQEQQPLDARNLCFLGTSVESGTARALVVATGPRTYLGTMAGTLARPEAQTAFDHGVAQFTLVLPSNMSVARVTWSSPMRPMM